VIIPASRKGNLYSSAFTIWNLEHGAKLWGTTSSDNPTPGGVLLTSSGCSKFQRHELRGPV